MPTSKRASTKIVVLLLVATTLGVEAFVAPTPRATSPPPMTSLSMAASSNFFDRFSRVLKSNVNKFLSGIENPEKVIVQAVEDMQTDMVQVRQAYAEAVATQRRLQRKYDQADAVASDWYRKAQLAVQKNQDQLGKQALTYRQQALEKAKDIRSQLDTQSVAVDRLYEAMQQLEAKLTEAMSKKQQLVARARTAKTTQQVNDMLNGVLSGITGGKTSMATFARMEEKVEALEAAAEVSAEMSAAIEPSSSLDSEFLLLEETSKVEEELQKMKASMKLLGPSEEERVRVTIPVGKGEKIFVN